MSVIDIGLIVFLVVVVVFSAVGVYRALKEDDA